MINRHTFARLAHRRYPELSARNFLALYYLATRGTEGDMVEWSVDALHDSDIIKAHEPKVTPFKDAGDF